MMPDPRGPEERIAAVRRGSLIYFTPETCDWILDLVLALREFNAWACSMPDAPGEMWSDDRLAWWGRKPPPSVVADLCERSW